MKNPASSHLRVALLQISSEGPAIEANAVKGEDFCRRAANQRADIALFPEMWSVGHSKYPQGDERARAKWLKLVVPRDGVFVQRFRNLARELRMAIAITYLEARTELPRDSLTLIGPDGVDIFTYAKVHTCSWDAPEESCTPGDEFCVGDVPTGGDTAKMGAMICFDREFPESPRMLMLKGAEVILTPNACELHEDESGLGDIRIAQFRPRAFENAIGVAMANYAAPQLDGGSVAFDVNGGTLVQAGPEEGYLSRSSISGAFANDAVLNVPTSGAAPRPMVRCVMNKRLIRSHKAEAKQSLRRNADVTHDFAMAKSAQAARFARLADEALNSRGPESNAKLSLSGEFSNAPMRSTPMVPERFNTQRRHNPGRRQTARQDCESVTNALRRSFFDSSPVVASPWKWTPRRRHAFASERFARSKTLATLNVQADRFSPQGSNCGWVLIVDQCYAKNDSATGQMIERIGDCFRPTNLDTAPEKSPPIPRLQVHGQVEQADGVSIGAKLRNVKCVLHQRR